MMTKTALENKKIENEKESIRETKRSNRVREKETERHNKFTEAMGATQTAVSGITGSMSGAGAMMRGAAALNDPHWYKPWDLADALVGNISPLKNSQVPVLGKKQYTGAQVYDVLPLVRCYYYYSTLGGSHENTSNSINQALIKLRNDMRRLNSRIGQWESGDLGQYLIAATELHCWMARWKKAICAASTFSGNKYLVGDAIIYQCGFKPHEMRLNLAKHRAAYNLLADKINKSVYIPKSFNYYERKVFMASAIYADDDCAMSQITHYCAYQFGYYNETDAKIEFTGYIEPGQFDCDNIVFRIQTYFLQPLQFSAAIADMTADIFTAYGSNLDAYYSVPAVAEGESLIFPHVTEPLHQMMNAIMVPATLGRRPSANTAATYLRSASILDPSDVVSTPTGYETLANAFLAFAPRANSDEIKQDTNGLIYQGKNASNRFGVEIIAEAEGSDTNRTSVCHFSGQSTLVELNHNTTPAILNFYKNDLTSDDILVSTRLRPMFAVRTDTDYNAKFLRAYTAGTEILAFCISSKANDYSGTLGLVNTLRTGITETTDIDPIYDFALAEDQCYDWNPMKIYVNSSIRLANLAFQAGNIMTVESENLSQINEYALTGLFSFPNPKQFKLEFSVGAKPSGFKKKFNK